MIDTAQPAPTRRLVLQSIAGFWTFYFCINTLKAALGEAPDQVDMMLRRLVVSAIGVALTFLLYLVLRPRAHWTPPQLIGLVFVTAVPVSLAYGGVNYLVFNIIAPSPALLAEIARYGDKATPLLEILGLAVAWYFFLVAWGVLYIAMAYAERARAAERQAQRYRGAAQAAELRALRYQVNPHFLFNTLNSLSALVLAGRASDAERMILNLSNFFRTTLASDPAGDVALTDEIATQRLYLDIEAARFPDRLRVDIAVPDALAHVPVPGLILQPLIENAIKHGVARSRRPVTVTITAQAEGERLVLSVCDDGEGLEQLMHGTGDLLSRPVPGTGDLLSRPVPGTGMGIRNVCDRLKARFGALATCRYGPVDEGGFRVDLVLPMRAPELLALAAE